MDLFTTVMTVLFLCYVLAIISMRAVGLHYRHVPERRRAALFNGTFTRVISDEEAAGITNDDGTVVLQPHFRLPIPALYFYGPQASHRGTRLNHSPKARKTAISSVCRITGADLAAATAGRRIRLRRWDQAVAIYGRQPIQVPATITPGVVINDWKDSYRQQRTSK